MQYEFQTTDSQTFAADGARQIAAPLRAAIAARGGASLGLSGGSTPGPVYEALAQENLDWSKIQLFLVDDRYVPADHQDSNQRLVRDTLVSRIHIPTENVHFPLTDQPLDICLAAYNEDLAELFTSFPPDVLTLGLGPDRHTASLFPPVPEHAFGEVLAVHTTTDQFAVRDRISISPLLIMAAQRQIILLKGKDKKRVFEESAAADIDPANHPLQVALATGRTAVIYTP